MERIQIIATDAAGLLGGGLIVHGCWRIYEPLGWIVGGLCLVAFAFAGARAR